MTKREREYQNRNKMNRFYGRITTACNDYALTTLKIRQLVMKGRVVPDALVEIQEDAIKDLEKLLQ